MLSLISLINKKLVNICEDSRKIKSETIFCATSEVEYNNKIFISEAIKRGAKHIIVSNNYNKDNRYANYIYVNNAKIFFSFIMSVKYLKKPKNITAITGTNGKTSCTELLKVICSFLKKNICSVGTLGVAIKKNYLKQNNIELTTPGVIKMHSILSLAKKKSTAT